MRTPQRWRQERHRRGSANATPTEMGFFCLFFLLKAGTYSCSLMLCSDVVGIMTVIGSMQHFKSFALRDLLIWDPSADDGWWPALSRHVNSLRPWWQWVPISLLVFFCLFFSWLSSVCDPWNWQRRVRTAESHTPYSDVMQRGQETIQRGEWKVPYSSIE